MKWDRIQKYRFLHLYQFGLILFGVFFVILAFFMIKNAPRLTLKGNNSIELNYKDEYKEAGYDLIVRGKNKSKDVLVDGRVNTSKLGKYVLTYSYHVGFFKVSKRRIVYVKDLQKPAIILSGAKEIYVCPGEKFLEDDYQAKDNYDGDLTKKVKVTEKKGEILYKVKDSHGNSTTLKRKIFYEDIVRPTITLKGSSHVLISLSSKYQEEGYEVSDNCSTNLHDKVEIVDDINYEKVGVYHITYKVVDQAGNFSEVTREVRIVPPKPAGVIYLTFDDGPRAGTTDKILDILKEEGVVATFFVTNNGPDELIKREALEGHTVGLHTATHNYEFLYSSALAYFDDLNQVSSRVERITGVKSKIIRFPGGSSNTISRKYTPGIMTYLTKEVINRGYRYYDWNISSLDAGGAKSSSEVFNNVISKLSFDKANMVLMHDIKTYTVEALRKIIKYAKENNYYFDKIDQDTEMVIQKVNN